LVGQKINVPPGPYQKENIKLKEIKMARIPLVEPENLTPEQAEIYRNSASGKMNIFRLLAHAPTCSPGYTQLAQAIFAKLEVPPQERELVVLMVARIEDCDYEWAQHVQIALDMGIDQNKIDAIAELQHENAALTDRERALFAFTRQTIANVRVDQATFDEVASFYTSRQIVELLFTIGSYMMLARIMEVAEIEVDAVHGAEVVREAMARAQAGAA
jgi:AhpD family alkylhydroperoxidase